jgi:hypothetical protein
MTASGEHSRGFDQGIPRLAIYHLHQMPGNRDIMEAEKQLPKRSR